MGHLISYCSITLDGVIDSTGRWVTLTPAHQAHTNELFAEAEAFLLGRNLYEGFKAVWPGMRDLSPIGPRINDIPKWVASRTLHGELGWNARLLDGDAMEAVATLKAGTGGMLLTTGGGRFAADLVRHGLVDEFRVYVHPVIWGGGQHLLHDLLRDQRFELLRVGDAAGVPELVYRPATA
jgi:dihydrofolate reductase